VQSEAEPPGRAEATEGDSILCGWFLTERILKKGEKSGGYL